MSNKKYNFQHYNYTKKGYLSFQTKKVEMLINEGKYNLAKNILKEILEEYPLDTIALMQWAQILIFERKYLEAKSILESVPLEKSFSMLVALYQKLDDWDNLKILYEMFYKKKNKDYCRKFGYKQQRIYLSSIFDGVCPVDNLSYIDQQMFQYSDQAAIEHIKQSHGGTDITKSLFVEDIDIEKLFYKVKEYLQQHPERGVINNNLLESFMFFYSGCGRGIDSGLYDTFVVKNIINTDKIITMYPQCIDNSNYDICRFEELVEEEKTFVKVRKGIDRFNLRYNKKD